MAVLDYKLDRKVVIFIKEDLAALPNRLKTDSGHAGFNAQSKPEDVLNHIHSHDPSGGSYKPWLTKTYLNGGIRHLEDLPRAKIALKLFHNNKPKLEHKDINHYKSLPELEKAIKPFDKPSDNKTNWSEKGKQLVDKNEAIILYNDKDYLIVQPHTAKASQHFGVNTKWCTAATKGENLFDKYNVHGKLIYILHKSTNKRFAVFEPKSMYREPEAFNEDDTELDSNKFNKDHPKAAEAVSKHLHPLNHFIVGRSTDIDPEYFKNDNTIYKAFKSTNDIKHLDKLVKDDDPWVKHAIAQHGLPHHLDKLVDDESPRVKEAVAQRGLPHYLNKLVNDDDPYVRAAVARQGLPHHLDKLVNDESSYIRQAVAQRGLPQHLDKLVNDDDPYVREAVAERGLPRHLDKLVNDENPYIRQAVAERGLPQHLDKLVDDKDRYVREAVAYRGLPHHLDKLVNDEDTHVRRTAINRLKNIKKGS